MRVLGRVGCLLVLLSVGLPVFGESAEEEGPLDAFNRANRSFNYWMLDWVFEPVARGYNWIVPKWGQGRIRNMLLNLERPRDFVNSLIQGKYGRAGHHLGALVVDSTVGIGGAFEPWNRWMGFEPPETTGESFGFYRIPAGPYLVLPLYGETCPRCLVGAVGDALLHPLFWISPEHRTEINAGRTVLTGVNTLARLMPSPWADDAAWEAYEQRLRERPTYPEAKDLFRENLELDVAE